MTQTNFERRGRQIVTTLFWGLVLYSLVSLVGSLVRDLYGGPPTPIGADPASYAYKWCVAQLEVSKMELENQTVYHMQSLHQAPDAAARWRAFKQTWQQKVEGYAQACAAPSDALLTSGFVYLQQLGDRCDALVANRQGATATLTSNLEDVLVRLRHAAEP